jgi:hypothetical protein
VRLLKKPPMEGTLDVFGLQQVLGHHLGVGHGHQHRFVDQLWARRTQRITNDGAPILADKVHRLAPAQGLHQRGQVLHQGGFVKKPAIGHAAGRIAAQVGCHGTKAGLCQGVHLVRPGGGDVGKAMQQQHLGAAALAQAGKALPIGVDDFGFHRATASL